jgi:hypothetical protein
MRTWEKGPLTPCTLVLPLAIALTLVLALPVLACWLAGRLMHQAMPWNLG